MAILRIAIFLDPAANLLIQTPNSDRMSCFHVGAVARFLQDAASAQFPRPCAA